MSIESRRREVITFFRSRRVDHKRNPVIVKHPKRDPSCPFQLFVRLHGHFAIDKRALAGVSCIFSSSVQWGLEVEVNGQITSVTCTLG